MPAPDAAPRHRHINRHGNDVTVTHFLPSSTRDEYGDIEYGEESEETKAIVSLGAKPREVNLENEESIVTEITVYLPDTVDVFPDVDEEGKWSRITDHSSGETYVVKQRVNRSDGILRCYCAIES